MQKRIRTRNDVLRLSFADLSRAPGIDLVRSRIKASMVFREFLKARRDLFNEQLVFGCFVEAVSAILNAVEEGERALRQYALEKIDIRDLEDEILLDLRRDLDDIVYEHSPMTVPRGTEASVEDIAEPLIEKFWREITSMIEQYQDQLQSASENKSFCRPHWLLAYEAELTKERAADRSI